MPLIPFAPLPYSYQPNATRPSEIALYKNCSNLFSAMIVLIPTLGDLYDQKFAMARAIAIVCTFATANPSDGGRVARTQAGRQCAPWNSQLS